MNQDLFTKAAKLQDQIDARKGNINSIKRLLDAIPHVECTIEQINRTSAYRCGNPDALTAFLNSELLRISAELEDLEKSFNEL